MRLRTFDDGPFALVDLPHGLAHGRAAGWSETFVPILKKRPSAVHSLENVKHMAAEMLCSLPTGVAVVRTIQNGSIEGAIIRVPYRGCPPVSDEQYAADLKAIMSRSIGTSMDDAMRQIDERERAIIESAKSHSLPRSEPTKASEFRIPAARDGGGRSEPSSGRDEHD